MDMKNDSASTRDSNSSVQWNDLNGKMCQIGCCGKESSKG